MHIQECPFTTVPRQGHTSVSQSSLELLGTRSPCYDQHVHVTSHRLALCTWRPALLPDQNYFLLYHHTHWSHSQGKPGQQRGTSNILYSTKELIVVA